MSPGGRAAAAGNVADLLAARLSALGVRRVFGLPLGDLAHLPVEDPDLAVLLADADGRIGEVDGAGRLGAALVAGPILHLSSQPGGRAPLQVVGSAEELLDALVDPPGVVVPGTMAVHIDLDLSAPVPSELSAAAAPQRRPVLTLDPSLAELRLCLVVGPGVVRARALDGLHSAARSMGVAIVNTWGAKGVERWDSPWHGGTAGLQARDWALVGADPTAAEEGVEPADVVLSCGLDPDELAGGALPHPVVQEVSPGELGALCARWPGPSPAAPNPRPPLFDALASVVRPLYESEAVPLSPARAALHLSGALPENAMAAADPGIAGFWVARAFPTSILNSVVVPARRAPGFAAAAALCGALDDRRILGVTDVEGAAHPITSELVDLARSLGHGLALQVWAPPDAIAVGGEAPACTSLDAHVALTLAQTEPQPPGTPPALVPVDFEPTDALIAVAGQVTAWDGLDGPG